MCVIWAFLVKQLNPVPCFSSGRGGRVGDWQLPEQEEKGAVKSLSTGRPCNALKVQYMGGRGQEVGGGLRAGLHYRLFQPYCCGGMICL